MSVLSPTEVALEQEVATLREQVAALTAPKAPKKPSAFKAWLKRVGRGVYAAFTTSEAVTAEKSLLTLIVVRALLFAGASAATVEGVKALLKAVGVAS